MIPIETLYEEARNLTTDLLPRLALEIPEQPTPTDTEPGIHKKIAAAPAPWNTPAALLYYEITGDAVAAETALSLRLYAKATYRNHSDTRAIDRLPILIAYAREKLNPDDGHELTATAITTWARQVRAHLDEALSTEQRWSKAPGNLVCPTCEARLELPPGWTKYADMPDLVCRRCAKAHGGHTWTRAIWAELVNPELDTHMTEADAIKHYRLSDAQIRVWHHRQPFTDIIKINGRRAYPRAQIEERMSARNDRIDA